MKSGWAIKKLGELGTIVRGKGIRRNETVDRGLPCIRYGEIYTSYNYILDCPHSFVSKDVFARCPKIKEGDVVFTLTGENKDEIAKALAYLGKDEIAAGGDLAIWSKHGCDPKFLAYMMYAPKLIEAKARASNGDIIVHASVKKMQEIDIPLPPLSEQKRIVAKIDAAFEKIDKLKANAEKNLANAKELFQSALDEAMRPKDGWVEKRLGEVAEIQRGSPRPIKDFITKNKDGYNWIKIGDVDPSGKFITSTAEKIRKEGLRKTRQVFAGEFLLSNSMSFGRPYILKIDGCIHDGWLVLRGFQKFYKEDFFYHLLRSKWIQNQFNSLAYGSTVRNLNSNSVSNVIVPIVALEEQQEIADSLDRLQSQAGVLQQNYSKQIADCMEMRQAVLREAFEGRL